MPKSLATFTDDELKALWDGLKAVYENNGHPEWLKAPKIYHEYVNILNAGQQQAQKVLQIEGKAPVDAKDKAAKIKKEIEDACAEVVEKEIEVGCSYGVGTQMGVIENADKIYVKGEAAEGRCEVRHEAGQVLLLDFWATWCPPCQGPMAHNQAMLEKRGADWGDKVRLIGLSIDQDVAKLKSHVADKKWTSVEHYHVRNGTCTADNEYGVQGVPHVLLVDTKGKIVFMGHPASRKIEEDIDNLLKGEVLTGEGTGASAAQGGAGDNKGCSAEEVAKFAADTKEWVGGMKEKCEKMQRAFLVMTCDQSHNMKDGSVSNDVTVHTVLVGPKDDVEAAHEECKKHSQGNWKNRDQVMPM